MTICLDEITEFESEITPCGRILSDPKSRFNHSCLVLQCLTQLPLGEQFKQLSSIRPRFDTQFSERLHIAKLTILRKAHTCKNRDAHNDSNPKLTNHISP